jgi:hypothetical protein
MSSKNPERPMTFDSKRSAAAELEPRQLEPRQLEPRQLEPTHIGQVFRYLSDEHQETKRRDDAEATWQAVEYRLRFGKKLSPGFWARLNAPGAGPLSAPKLAFLAAAAAVCLAAGGAGWLLSESTGKAAIAHRAGTTDAASRADGVRNNSLTGSSPKDDSILHYDVTSATGQNLGLAPSPGTSQVLATEQESKQVRFSDSSVIELRPYTTLRISVLQSGTVVARLVQGALEVNVHHQERTDYRFQAGDYEVKVVGTAFNLAFEPQPSRFDLNLHEGRVIVDDGAGQTRVLESGQALHLPGDDGALGSVSLDSLADHDSTTASAQEPGTSTAPSYRELARKGQFQAIVSAARRSGVDRVLAAKGPAELHELAQAARYTGQVALSEKVFSYLASQHARSSEGRGAAFFRGRLAEDGGRFQQAQRHYHAYLGQGGGAYAAEALGRELTLVQKLKGPSAARPLAAEYLRRFPRGAYRTLAQSLAQGSPGQGSSGQGSSAQGSSASSAPR